MTSKNNTGKIKRRGNKPVKDKEYFGGDKGMIPENYFIYQSQHMMPQGVTCTIL